MPLTPADVHNVAFKKPPIGKRGYDEEEVDAFLDIVEVELARLIEENNDLRARAGGSVSIAKSAGGDDSALASELNSAREQNGRLQAHVVELEKALTQGKSGAQQQVVALQQQLQTLEQSLAQSRQELEQARGLAAQAQQAAEQARAQAANAPAAQPTVSTSPTDQHAQAVQVLALAQATADQHLAQSKAEADRLLAEAQAQSQQHLNEVQARARQVEDESNSRASRVVSDAEDHARSVTGPLEERRVQLERRVEELRGFERDYRARLKSYIEAQLHDLEATNRIEPSDGRSNEYAEAQAQ